MARVQLDEDDGYQQWRTETESDVGQDWLLRVRNLWRTNYLDKIRDSKYITIDKIVFQLVAVDVSILVSLQQELLLLGSSSAIRTAIVDPKRDMKMFRELGFNAWEPTIPPSVARSTEIAIARILGSVSALTDISCDNTSITMLASIVTACRHVILLKVSFLTNEEHTLDQLSSFQGALVARQSTLESVSLSNVKEDLFREVCPILWELPKLNRLLIRGCWLISRPLIIACPQDATLFDDLLKRSKLQDLELESLQFTSDEAASVFCNAIQAATLEHLTLGAHVHIPSSERLHFVTSLANSHVRSLDLSVPVGNDAIHAFAAAFAASQTFVTEYLNIYVPQTTPQLSFWYGMDRPEPRNEGFTGEWADQVKRTLDLNRERRITSHVFQRLAENRENVGSQPLAEVFAVHPAIVFEHMRNDKCGLMSVIQETTVSQKAGGKKCDIRRCIRFCGRILLERYASYENPR